MYCRAPTSSCFRCIANDYLRLLLPYVNGGTSNKSRSSLIPTIYGACGVSDICAGQIMAAGNELISQSHGNVLQKTTSSDKRNQISNECYIRCMIVLVLLLLHNTREDRITTVKNGAEHSVNTVTATLPKTRHLPMGHRVPKMTLGPGFMTLTRLAQASQRKTANGKATTPFKQDRLPLVKRVDTNQVLTKLQGFKRRGWPKLKRLSRVIHRTSRRVLLFRAQLSVLQSEFEDRTSSGNS